MYALPVHVCHLLHPSHPPLYDHPLDLKFEKCDIRSDVAGLHGEEYEDDCLQGSCTVSGRNWPTF
jgi:hypothetical protein